MMSMRFTLFFTFCFSFEIHFLFIEDNATCSTSDQSLCCFIFDITRVLWICEGVISGVSCTFRCTSPVARTVSGLIGHVCLPQWQTRHLRPTFTIYFLAGHGMYFPCAPQNVTSARGFHKLAPVNNTILFLKVTIHITTFKGPPTIWISDFTVVFPLCLRTLLPAPTTSCRNAFTFYIVHCTPLSHLYHQEYFQLPQYLHLSMYLD